MSRQGMNDSDHHEGHREAQRPRSHADSTSGGISSLSVQVPYPDCREYLIAAMNGWLWQRSTTRRSCGAIEDGAVVRTAAEAWGRRVQWRERPWRPRCG